MSDVNFVIIRGRFTKDPELRYSTSGKAYVKFAIANNPYYQKDKKEQDVSFFNCEAWEGSAEFINKHFAKGKQIEIEGKLIQNRYKDKNGVDMQSVFIRVNQVHFVGMNKNSGSDVKQNENDTYSDDKVIPY